MSDSDKDDDQAKQQDWAKENAHNLFTNPYPEFNKPGDPMDFPHLRARWERAAPKALTDQAYARMNQYMRTHMSFSQLRSDPETWAKAKRDIEHAMAAIGRAAAYTVECLELGFLPDSLVDKLREALREYDAAKESDHGA